MKSDPASRSSRLDLHYRPLRQVLGIAALTILAGCGQASPSIRTQAAHADPTVPTEETVPTIGVSVQPQEEKVVPSRLSNLVSRLDPASRQARLLADGTVSLADVRSAVTNTIQCAEDAASSMDLKVAFDLSTDADGIPSYVADLNLENASDPSQASAKWEAKFRSCEAKEKSVVVASYTNANPFDSAGVNQLEAALLADGAIQE